VAGLGSEDLEGMDPLGGRPSQGQGKQAGGLASQNGSKTRLGSLVSAQRGE